MSEIQSLDKTRQDKTRQDKQIFVALEICMERIAELALQEMYGIQMVYLLQSQQHRAVADSRISWRLKNWMRNY